MITVVGECTQAAKDDIHRLIAGALGHLVQGEHEEDMCTVFVPFLLNSTHAILFMQKPALKVLSSCCESSRNFARAALLQTTQLFGTLTWQTLCSQLSQERGSVRPWC